MTDLETKRIDGFEIKNADLGEVVAVVSTMDVVDRDGDVVLSGAIRDGSTVKLSAYEHDVVLESRAPVGTGTVHIEGNRAVLKARYFMSTERGRDAFHTVKEMGADSEWSIGFAKRVKTAPMTDDWKTKGARRLIAGLELWEASPVLVGANAFTGTVSAKTAAAIEQADGAGPDIIASPSDSPPVVEVKSDLPVDVLADVRAQLKTAREMVQALETQEANLVATEIFHRFQRNMKQAQ